MNVFHVNVQNLNTYANKDSNNGDIMNRKIIAIFAIFVLAIVCASAVQAVEATQNVKIAGVDFQIPDGFKENNKFSANAEPDESGKVFNSVKAYEKGDDVIYICVGNYSDREITLDDVSEMGSESKTINGVEGYTYDEGWVAGYEDKTLYGFLYPKNGDFVLILTTDESLLDSVVVK